MASTSLTMFADISFLPVLVAADPDVGLFKRKGLDVSIELVTTGVHTMQALAEGRCSVAATAAGHAYRMWMRGYRIKCVSFCQLGSGYDLLVNATSPVAYGDWQGLRGKTLGVPVKGADGHAITEYLLLSHGLDPSKDVVLAETSQIESNGKGKTSNPGLVLPVSHKLDLLLSGKVDSIHSIPPLYPLYLEAGGKTVAKNFYCWGDDPLLRTLPTGGIVVRADYLARNGAVVDAIVEAVAQAAQYALDNPEGAAKVYHRRLPHYPYQRILAGVVDSNQRKCWPADPRVTRAGVEGLNRIYETVGLASMLTTTKLNIKTIFPEEECFQISN